MGFHYVARRPLKVSGRMVQPGEIVPEAETWRDIQTYVDNGSLAVAVEVPEGAIENAELRDEVAALKAAFADLSGRVTALEKGPDPEEDDLDAFFDADDLRTWDRAQLDELAADLGIEKAGERGTEDLIAEIVTIPVEISVEEEAAGEGARTGEATPTGETADATPPAKTVDLSGWKLEPLLALAKDAGIQDPKFTKKADAVAAIEAATTPEQLAALVAAQEGKP